MYCLQVLSIPAGRPAPTTVKQAWLGLRLPLYTNHFEKPEPQVIAGELVYKTPVITGLAILELHNPQAADWWYKNTQTVQLGADFLFRRDECRVFDGLPSLGAENLFGQVKIGELFKTLKASQKYQEVFLVLRNRVGSHWKHLKKVSFTKASAMVIADLVQLGVWNRLINCTSEKKYQRLLTAGKDFLAEVAHFAEAKGVSVDRRLLDRPLSYVDLLIRQGYLEEAEDGVMATDKAETMAWRSRMAANAKNN